MQKEINLLPRKNVGFLQQERTIMTARFIAIFSVVIVICTFVALFFLQKNFSLAAIESQQENVKSHLALLHNKITKQLALTERTKKIEKILKNRSSLVDKVAFIQKQVPSSVSIQTLYISKTDMTIYVTSSSLVSLQQFIDSLTALVAKKTFLQKLTIDNVIINQNTGVYSVSVKGVLL